MEIVHVGCTTGRYANGDRRIRYHIVVEERSFWQIAAGKAFHKTHAKLEELFPKSWTRNWRWASAWDVRCDRMNRGERRFELEVPQRWVEKHYPSFVKYFEDEDDNLEKAWDKGIPVDILVEPNAHRDVKGRRRKV